MTQGYELCRCESPEGRGLCADCERKIELAEKAGLQIFNEDWHGEVEFIGKDEDFNKYHELLAYGEEESHDCDQPINCTYCWELKNQ